MRDFLSDAVVFGTSAQPNQARLPFAGKVLAERVAQSA